MTLSKEEPSRRNLLAAARSLGLFILPFVSALSSACQLGPTAQSGAGLVLPRMEGIQRLPFDGWVSTLAFSRRGHTLVVGGCQDPEAAGSGLNDGEPCTRGVVQVWNLEKSQSETTMTLPRAVAALAVSQDGSKWVAGDSEGRLILSTNKTIPRPYHQKGEIMALAFSPDGKWIASGSLDVSFPLGIMDVVTGGVIKVKAKFDPVTALAFHPDGKVLAVGMSKGRLVVWDFASSSAPVQVTPGGSERHAITSTIFSPDGVYLAYGRRNGQVVIWDRSSQQPLVEFAGSSSVTGLEFSPDGQYLAIGQDNGRVLLVESRNAHQVWSERHAFSVSDMAYSPDGSSLVVAVQRHVYLYHVGESMSLSPQHRTQINGETNRGRTKKAGVSSAVASRTFARVLEISQQEFLRLLPFDRLVAKAVGAMVASVPEASVEPVESSRMRMLVVQANRRSVSVDLARLHRAEGGEGIREAVRAFESVQRFLLEAAPGAAARLEDVAVKAVVAELGPSVRLVRMSGESGAASVGESAQADGDQTARLLEEDRVPYLKVSRFSASTSRQVGVWLGSVAAPRRPTGAPILDLRNNPGGELDSAVQTASLLLPKGQLVTGLILRKTGDWVEYRSRGVASSQGPFVVLVNEQTAGTAEMLACAMQVAGVGILVGSRTAGVNEVYQTFVLPGGEGLRISTARFDCPDGRNLRWEGHDVDLSADRAASVEAIPVGGASLWSVPGVHRPVHMAVGMPGTTDRGLTLGIQVALCLGTAHGKGDTTLRNQTMTRPKDHLASCGMSPS